MMNSNFQLMQHHKYSLHEIEDLMPWERAIYIFLLSQWVEKENQRVQKENEDMKSQASKARRR